MYLSLNGAWKVNHISFREDIGPILEEDFIPEGWIDACVPEEIHGALRRAGVIRGHVYGKEPEEEKWIEEKDWIYYKEFFMSERIPEGAEALLVCEGLDTFCEVYLNGIFVGKGCNMHRTFQMDVREALQCGERNVLVVRFFSPVKYVEDMDDRGIFSITTSDRILARKAQMNYSWDFCGRTVTTGIWKNIGIRVKEKAEIAEYRLFTREIGEDFAQVRLEAQVERPEGGLPDEGEEKEGACAREGGDPSREERNGGGCAGEGAAACIRPREEGYRLRIVFLMDGKEAAAAEVAVCWGRPGRMATVDDRGQTASEQGVALDSRGQAPVGQGAVSDGCGQAALEQDAALDSSGQASVGQGAVSDGCGQAASEQGVALDRSGQAPVGRNAASDGLRRTASVSLDIRVENPCLWWPRPYGEQPLYEVRIGLYHGGTLLDERRQRFGIRTVEVLQEQQPDGRSFQFAVNGRKLFIRGANWVPMKVVYTDICEEDYEVYLDYAARGNISMLRIWGGGIYESPRMFELCDEKGILIWSDFMLACGIYPQNEAFLENVRLEAEEVVRRYRNYTCLAVWSGDNENGQAYGWAGRPYEFQKDKIGNEVLYEVCKRLDPERYYLPTSPCSPDENYKGGDNPSSPYQGDQHIYIMSADRGVNAYRDYGKNYYKRILGIRPRFVSEFGFISIPEKDTFYRFNYLREPLRYPGEMVEFLPSCKKYLDAQNFDKAIYYSQLFNAMALKYWIEYFRSLKGTCSGTLYWKFNDPLADCAVGGIFPSHMAAVDMYQHPKMTYYYTRRAYADFLVSFVECGDGRDGLDVWAANELPEAKEGTLVVLRMDFEGNVLWKKECVCTAGADSATLLCHIDGRELEGSEAYSQYLKLSFTADGGEYVNRYYFADLNENDCLKLPEAGLGVLSLCLVEKGPEMCAASPCGGSSVEAGDPIVLRVRLRSENFTRGVRLNILDVRADYSDNYFDMDAGEEKEVIITLLSGESAEELKAMALYVEAENQKRVTLPLWRGL